MKLYSRDLSNFSAKSRIVIYEKGLDVEMVDPPGGMGSQEYKKLNPLGKIPALQLDNGRMIAESEVINEYLEDKFPAEPLLPQDAEGWAAVRITGVRPRPARHDIAPGVQRPSWLFHRWLWRAWIRAISRLVELAGRSSLGRHVFRIP